MDCNENMDFDKVSFDEDVEGTDLHLSHVGDLNLELLDLNDSNDIPVSVNISPKSTDRIAEDVEGVILDLLESGDRNSLLLLTGERPDLSSDLDANLHADFASWYSQAVLYNPALKWYSRLTNILPSDQFFVKGGQLHIRLPKTTFSKLICPFLGDFDRKFYETSPIVHLVLNVSEKIAQESLSNKQNLNKQLVRHNDEDGLDLGQSGLELFFETDDVAHAGSEVRIDDNDSLNQPSMREVQASLNLADLSNKAIAEYFVDKGYSEKQASEKMSECIPEKARRNEISVLVSMAKKLHNSPLQYLKPVARRLNPGKDDFKWDE